MQTDLNLPLIAESVVNHEGTVYGLMKSPDSTEKQLVVRGNIADFKGQPSGD